MNADLPIMAQDFAADGQAILDAYRAGVPFAFARFGDGERAIAQGRQFVGNSQWEFKGATDDALPILMHAALSDDIPRYYVGIACPCCDRRGHHWTLGQVRAPLTRVTYSNLLVNGNYRYFRPWLRELPRDSYMLVSCHKGADLRVPKNAVTPLWDYRSALDKILATDRPVLMAAGPLASVMVHKYWRDGPRKFACLDVGSIVDDALYGKRSRKYHLPQEPLSRKICHWS